MSSTDQLPLWLENKPLVKTLHETSLRWLRREKLCNCTRKAWVRVARDKTNTPYCFDCGITAALQIDNPPQDKINKELTHHTWEHK